MGSTPVSERSFEEPEVRTLSTDFHANPVRSELPPEEAFVVRKLCPVIEHALMEPDEGVFAKLTLTGRHLDRVTVIGAVMLDGATADAIVHRGEPSEISAAVGCRNCRLQLGFDYLGTTVACLGPGYSLDVRKGRLVEPAND